MVARFSLVLLVLAMGSALGAQIKVTPVQKVLEMMNGMKSKGEAMMAEEDKIMATYAEWVDDTSRQLRFDIETAEREIEELLAFIEKADNKVARLAESIGVLQGEIAQYEKQKADAIAVREKEHEEYIKVSTDFSESVDALERAIVVVQKQNYNRPQAEMLLQQMSKTAPGIRHVLAAFLQEQEEQEQQPGAPVVAAYRSQGGGILEMLEGLHQKFKAQLDQTNEEEVKAQHYYELEVQHLTDVITKAESEVAEQTAEKAETEAASAKAKGKLVDTRKSKAEDEATLAEVLATFKSKSATFAANQQVRKDEIAALSKAIEIISQPDVSESYSEHVDPNLLQVGTKPLSLLQQSSRTGRTMAIRSASEFLQKQAARLHSTMLAKMAIMVAGNPFEKVIGLIEDLLAKLKEEAAAEAEHKAWCDEQLKENKLKRNAKTAAVEKLTAEVEGLTADIQTMADQIDTLVKEQAELAKAMKEATEIREKEKAKNMDTIADAIAGSKAVRSAIVVLKDFYSSQEEFLQESKQVPEMEEYKGMQRRKGGVVSMLQVIETDFLRLEAETKATEAESVKVYDAFMVESTKTKQIKHNEEVKLRLDKDDAEFKKSETIKDLKWEQKQLDEAKKYFEYLKPNCLEIHVSFEERAQKRQEEIDALNEAWAILDAKDGGESTYTQS